MKHSEAAHIVRGMLIGAQKSRSISQENFGDLGEFGEQVLAELSPWLFGRMSCLPLLIRLVDELDNGGQISPVTFMNLMHIASREPTIGACASGYGYNVPLVAPDIDTYVGGWEPE